MISRVQQNTSIQADVSSARHTVTCVCVCAPRHMFVCVCVHMHVFTCGLAEFHLIEIPCIRAVQPASSSEHFWLWSGSVLFKHLCVSEFPGVVLVFWVSVYRVRQPFRGLLFWFWLYTLNNISICPECMSVSHMDVWLSTLAFSQLVWMDVFVYVVHPCLFTHHRESRAFAPWPPPHAYTDTVRVFSLSLSRSPILMWRPPEKCGSDPSKKGMCTINVYSTSSALVLTAPY